MAVHNDDLTDDEFELVKAFRDGEQGDVLRWLGQRKPPPQWALEGVRVDDDLEMDDHPMRSEGDGGCWVSTWTWVLAPEVDEAGDDEENCESGPADP